MKMRIGAHEMARSAKRGHRHGGWVVAVGLMLSCNQADPETEMDPEGASESGAPAGAGPSPGPASSAPGDANAAATQAAVSSNPEGVEGPGTTDADPGAVSGSESGASTSAEPDVSQEEAPEAVAEPEPAQEASSGVAQDVEDYFPLVDGGSWVYRHTHQVDGQWIEEVFMAATTFDGEPAFLVSDTPDLSQEISLQTWQRIGSAVSRVYREQTLDGDVVLTVTYDPGFLRFDSSWNAVGVVTDNVYRREETKPDGTSSAAIREQTFTVLDTAASVTVEAGSFDDCLLVERARADNGSTAHFWFARGVGKVREEDPETQTVEELVSFELP